jgi:hypothetical protein
MSTPVGIAYFRTVCWQVEGQFLGREYPFYMQIGFRYGLQSQAQCAQKEPPMITLSLTFLDISYISE